MSADFYTNLMDSPVWATVRNHRSGDHTPRGNALRDAIALPARDVGGELDSALVQRLLSDAGDEPGVLPFIQETLVMFWSHAQSLEIGLSAYTRLIGENGGRSGLQVALAEHAEYVYQGVLADDGERSQATRALLRLVQLGEGRADTRRQQTLWPAMCGSGRRTGTARRIMPNRRHGILRGRPRRRVCGPCAAGRGATTGTSCDVPTGMMTSRRTSITT